MEASSLTFAFTVCSITGFRAKDLLVKHTGLITQDEMERDANSEERAARVLLGVGDPRDPKRITAASAPPCTPLLRLSTKHANKVVAEMRFPVEGQELETIKRAVEPVRKVLAKLRLHGDVHLTDELLSGLAASLPLLRTVKIEPNAARQNGVRGPGLTQMVGKLQRLQVLRLSHSGALEHVALQSASLRCVVLTGLVRIKSCHLVMPQLSRLELEALQASEEAVTGLAQSIAGCRQLHWLELSRVVQSEEALYAMALPALPLVALCLKTHALPPANVAPFVAQLSWSTLSTLELSLPLGDDALELIGRCGSNSLRHLVLANGAYAHASSAGFSALLSAASCLTHVTIQDDNIMLLELQSDSLTDLTIGHCPVLTQLRISCPALTTFVLEHNGELSRAGFELDDCKLLNVKIGDTVDEEIAECIQGMVQSDGRRVRARN